MKHRKTERELAERDFADAGEPLVEVALSRRLELAPDLEPSSEGALMLRDAESGETFVVDAAPDWASMLRDLEEDGSCEIARLESGPGLAACDAE